MFRNLRQHKMFFIIRNLVIAELVVYSAFLLLSALFYWAQSYREHVSFLANYVPFNVIELVGVALVQVAIVVFVLLRAGRHLIGVREEPNVRHLLRSGENEKLEFKTTFRWDLKRNQVNKELERGIMKTITAFLNSQGGQLVIGVDDGKGIIGLTPDMNSLAKKNEDGFENHFNNLFSSMIGPEFRRHVKLSFHEIGGEYVCLVTVERAHQPAYLKTEGGEDFFIRTGNATTPLKMSQAASYVANWNQR
ncbi:MAG TPA: ATP-binding protein [Candidatus Paceibacterota bacterium]|nr:ATP-binding protein [Candidatus Paceibacterota bacterium]